MTTNTANKPVAASTTVASDDVNARKLALVRKLASIPCHPATSAGNRLPSKRASRIASALNAAFCFDASTGRITMGHTGSAVLALMASEGIRFAE